MAKANRIYVRSAIIILMLSASIKLTEAFRGAPYLQRGDWVFLYVLGSSFWTTGNVMLLGAAYELVIAGILMFSDGLVFQNVIALMLSCSFVMYRFIHWSIGAPDPCPCLGRVGEWLKVSSTIMGYMSMSMLVYLLAGSTAFLFSQALKGRLRLRD